jgi:hypothetical protein
MRTAVTPSQRYTPLRLTDKTFETTTGVHIKSIGPLRSEAEEEAPSGHPEGTSTVEAMLDALYNDPMNVYVEGKKLALRGCAAYIVEETMEQWSDSVFITVRACCQMTWHG